MMGFLEFMFFFGVFTYAVRHDFWLDTPWTNKGTVEVGLTKQQNEVFDKWSRGVSHDHKAA